MSLLPFYLRLWKNMARSLSVVPHLNQCSWLSTSTTPESYWIPTLCLISCHIDLNSHLERATLQNMLREVGVPAILKPACGTGSVLIQKINSFDDLLHAIDSSKKHRSSVIGSHVPLSSKFLDLSRYPLALTDGLMILEKYVDGEIIELDGWVF